MPSLCRPDNCIVTTGPHQQLNPVGCLCKLMTVVDLCLSWIRMGQSLWRPVQSFLTISTFPQKVPVPVRDTPSASSPCLHKLNLPYDRLLVSSERSMTQYTSRHMRMCKSEMPWDFFVCVYKYLKSKIWTKHSWNARMISHHEIPDWWPASTPGSPLR